MTKLLAMCFKHFSRFVDECGDLLQFFWSCLKSHLIHLKKILLLPSFLSVPVYFHQNGRSSLFGWRTPVLLKPVSYGITWAWYSLMSVMDLSALS